MPSDDKQVERKRLEIEAAKLRLEALALSFENEKQNRADYNHMSRLTADYALNAIRTIVIINGGATLSLLAFIGTFSKTGNQLEGVDLAVTVKALYYFATGTGLASSTVAFGYVARLARGPHKSIAYHVLTAIGVTLGLASVALFFVGVNSMPGAFINAKAKPSP